MQDNQDPLKQDPLKRYVKGMNAVQPSLLDPIQAAGWRAANPQRNAPVGDPGPGFVELMMKYSEGKSWTKWTALLFGTCALIYCFVNSYSFIATLAITAVATFCGYTIIGLFVLSLQMLLVGVLAAAIFFILYGIFWIL